MNARRLIRELLVSVGVLLFSGIVVSAQTVGASIQGAITDANGAAVRNAAVEVRNVSTGVTHSAVTDADGRYRVPLLPPGDYEIRVTASGFQPVLRRGVSLAVGQDAVADATLTIGRIENTVTVEGGAATVNTTSAALSGLVTKQEIRDLPLNGRSFQQLALLQTGVAAALAAGNDPVGGRTPKISINGARPEQNNFLLDGTDINNVYDTAFELQPENTRGTLGRNTLIGPGLVSVDASVGKSFSLGESRSLLFRAEVFNLPNHPNFAVPSNQIAFTSTAGRITSTVTTSRQIQLGVKLTF